MGNSRKSRSPEAVVSSLALFTKGSRVVLGLSGGLDSIVLLHVLKGLESPLGFSLSCVHVNHKISENAGIWAKFCEDQCRILDVPIVIEEVDISPHLSSGIEAAARTARYAVFEKLDADRIVLAHHRDDQAETVLLQLFRGAGLDGLAAMGESVPFGKKTVLRPFLSLSRREIEAYARERGLEWIEDESNANPGYDRNFVRHMLFPVIEARFPAFRETVSRSARHFAESSRLLEELAEIDGSDAIRDGRLDVSSLSRLSPSRARNLLRHYLALEGMRMPSSRRLEEMLRQFASKGACVAHDGREIRCYRGFVHVVDAFPVSRDFRNNWEGESRMDIPELGGILRFENGENGLDPGKLFDVNVRGRQGGEHLRTHAHRPTKRLKHLFQEKGIPPWQRDRMPLLYCGDHLVWVPGLGMDPDYRSDPGKSGLVPSWEPI
ncbi:MAG TPA: tRNA lysidine(34) synthetase TilS [Burkholderiales bacterium]|nr:tRNA lysidine(34) synthetase TilS [Burkholderiales bacterium]